MSCGNCSHCQEEARLCARNTWAFASHIMDFVCIELGIRRSEMLAKERTERLVLPRRIAAWLIRDLTDLPTLAIGPIMNRDHSTIIVGTQEIDRRMASSTAFATKINEMRAKLSGEKRAAA
jgi:chromosomal replication initiator protein